MIFDYSSYIIYDRDISSKTKLARCGRYRIKSVQCFMGHYDLDLYVKVGITLPLLYHGKVLRDFSLGLIMGRFNVSSAIMF